MTIRPNETWEEYRKRRDKEVKEYYEALSLRYEKAFAKDKVNWLRVKFDPVTEKYCDERAEQKYLANFGGGLCQDWRPNHHLVSNDNSEPERQKIIEQEEKLRQQCGVFGTFPQAKVNRVTTGHKDKPYKPKRNSNRNPIKKVTYRE